MERAEAPQERMIECVHVEGFNKMEYGTDTIKRDYNLNKIETVEVSWLVRGRIHIEKIHIRL